MALRIVEPAFAPGVTESHDVLQILNAWKLEAVCWRCSHGLSWQVMWHRSLCKGPWP